MNATSVLFHTVKSIVLSRQFRLARTLPPESVRAFLKKLQPVNTPIPLLRVGAHSDGGYLVPDDLMGIVGCFSPGVSTVADFELDLAKRGIPCYLADLSVDAPPVTHELFQFDKLFLDSHNSSTTIRLDDWIAKHAEGSGDLLLQMDIEGAEYRVLQATPRDALTRFRIMVIEFHRMDALFDPMGFDLIALTFDRLLPDFDIVHIHPNNFARPLAIGNVAIPPFLEFTFLRKDRAASRVPARSFPHPLDSPNIPEKSDVLLPRCWIE